MAQVRGELVFWGGDGEIVEEEEGKEEKSLRLGGEKGLGGRKKLDVSERVSGGGPLKVQVGLQPSAPQWKGYPGGENFWVAGVRDYAR